MLYGVIPVPAGAPAGGLASALRFFSGLDVHPASHAAQPVMDDALIIAFAGRDEPNGASPAGWYAMKLVPHEFVCAALHTVDVPLPTTGVPEAIAAGSNLNVLPVIETLRVSH